MLVDTTSSDIRTEQIPNTMSCENGIPYGTGPSNDAVGAIIAQNKYTSTDIPDNRDPQNKTAEERGADIIRFFKGKSLAGRPLHSEFAFAVAGVWGAESGIKTWSYNSNEQQTGGGVQGVHTTSDYGNYKGNKLYHTEENMKRYGYGKGVAQWSWERNLLFKDWYNSGAGGTQKPFSTIDENASAITATSVANQTGFAWKEMQERTGEFTSVVNSINHASPGSDEFKNNILKCVDAVTRGFENGSNAKMRSPESMNSYKGGYQSELKKRCDWALGLYEKLKNDTALTDW